jgi:hypothetical protein
LWACAQLIALWLVWSINQSCRGSNDDLYALHYAMERGGWLVSNDQFRAEVQPSFRRRRRCRFVLLALSAPQSFDTRTHTSDDACCLCTHHCLAATQMHSQHGKRKKVLTNGEQVDMKDFQDTHQIRFSFVMQEFMPDPDSPHLRG